jgi:cyanobactin maturation PatA/PatG family protease
LPGLPELCAETVGTPEIRVAVLDGLVDRAHPCFDGADLVDLELSAGADVAAALDHGTHVASVIFGQSGSPVTGIAPRCRGIVIPVYSANADGSQVRCNQIDLARAITAAIDQGAHIVNISGGELSPGGQMLDFLERAVRQCAARNVLVIAAAGNDGCACLHVPAAAPSVIAVGAEDAEGRPLAFTNWGSAYARNGIMAPGEDIVGAAPGGGVVPRTGTSFATPIVSGVAALLLSLQVAQGKKPDPGAVRSALLESATPCDPAASTDCARALRGRVNIAGARRLIAGDARAEEPSVRTASAEADRSPRRPALPPSSASAEIGSKTRGKDRPMSEQSVMPAEIVPQAVEQSAAGPVVATPASALAVAGASPSALAIDLVKERVQAHPAIARRVAEMAPSVVSPSQCGCSSKGSSQFVYALGYLHYDFGTEARLDYFIQELGGKEANPLDPVKMASHLKDHQADANALIWTLNIDSTPIYALRPEDQFAVLSYLRLIQFLLDQENEGVERMSVGGTIVGSTRLMNGTVVPTLAPLLRGMYNWQTDALVQSVAGKAPAATDAAAATAYEAKSDGIKNFLQRIYFELRNLGQSASDRAINYLATNAYQLNKIYAEVVGLQMVLDKIEVVRSPICRPESDCWDVSMVFFNPVKMLEKARRVYRQTVDVSDIIPVTVGDVRSWDVY